MTPNPPALEAIAWMYEDDFDRKYVTMERHLYRIADQIGWTEIPLTDLNKANEAIQALADENERLKVRLEVVDGWSEDADGIACRNDTIALLDKRIAAAEARAIAAETSLQATAEAAAAHLKRAIAAEEALKRIDGHVSHGKMGDWSIALNEIREIARAALTQKEGGR